MGRIENAEVFRDTERMCRENGRLRAAIVASRKGQRLIVEGAAEREEIGVTLEQALEGKQLQPHLP